MSTSNDLIRTWFKFICYMGHRFLSLNEWDHRAQMGGQTIDIPSRIPIHHPYIHYVIMNYGWFCAQTHVWGFDFGFLASEITICRLQGSPNRWKKHIFQDVIDDVDSINSRFPTSWGLRKKKSHSMAGFQLKHITPRAVMSSMWAVVIGQMCGVLATLLPHDVTRRAPRSSWLCWRWFLSFSQEDIHHLPSGNLT